MKLPLHSTNPQQIQYTAKKFDVVSSFVAKKSLIKSGFLKGGADYRIRTDDLPLTRRLLYQLS